MWAFLCVYVCVYAWLHVLRTFTEAVYVYVCMCLFSCTNDINEVVVYVHVSVCMY